MCVAQRLGPTYLRASQGRKQNAFAIFFGCCASAVTPRASNTTAKRIDGTAAFFIAHLVWALSITRIEIKGKCDLAGGRRQEFVEWKNQIFSLRLN
jgi:hypothetical protein